jgi:predicted nucleotidyltransferase
MFFVLVALPNRKQHDKEGHGSWRNLRASTEIDRKMTLPRLDLQKRYREQLEALLDALAPDLTVWAFGSRVNGTNHDGSDLDLVLRNPENPSLKTKNLTLIRAALSASDLPILVDVLDWAQLSDSLREEIEKSYAVVREGNTGR